MKITTKTEIIMSFICPIGILMATIINSIGVISFNTEVLVVCMLAMLHLILWAFCSANRE